MDLYKAIGQSLKARRDALKWTQAELAAAAKLHRSSVANIETGRQRIALDDLVALAGALGIDYRTVLPDPSSLDAIRMEQGGQEFGQRTRDFLSRHGALDMQSKKDDPA